MQRSAKLFFAFLWLLIVANFWAGCNDVQVDSHLSSFHLKVGLNQTGLIPADKIYCRLLVIRQDDLETIFNQNVLLKSDGMASFAATNIEEGTYNFIITLFSMMTKGLPEQELLLLKVEKVVNLTQNNNQITLAEEDFPQNLPDDDDDGYSNLAEVVKGSAPLNQQDIPPK